MTDAEVGKLWRDAWICYNYGRSEYFEHDNRIKLIRKLVEERANVYRASLCGYCSTPHENEETTKLAVPNALRDFNIPEKEFDNSLTAKGI